MRKRFFLTVALLALVVSAIFADVQTPVIREFDIVNSPAVDFSQLKIGLNEKAFCEVQSIDSDNQIIIFHYTSLHGLSALSCTVTMQITEDKITFTAKKFKKGTKGALLKDGDEDKVNRIITDLDEFLDSVMAEL